MQPKLVVASIGFEPDDDHLIKAILRHSSARPQGYRLIDSTDKANASLMILNVDNPSAVARWQTLATRAAVPPTVFVGSTAPTPDQPLVTPPIRPLRLLAACDSMPKISPSVSEKSKVLEGEQVTADSSQPSENAPAPATSTTPATPDSPAVADKAPLVEEGRYRVLVVDDSKAVRQQVGKVLRSVNAHVDFAVDGEEAIAAVSQNKYDIIFLDVVMPGIDGYAVCKRIKRNKTTQQTPVIMLTGKSSPFDKIKGKLSGCDAYLTKPVARSNFDKIIDKHLAPAIGE